jgi:hypothetical protein
MAGRNVVTTVQDASAVRDYARAHQIGFIGFWSLGRTTGTARGRLTRAPDAAASPRTPTPSPARFGEPDWASPPREATAVAAYREYSIVWAQVIFYAER